MKVFLGGTCNGSTWRKELIPKLTIDYFDPVVDDWNEEAQAREIQERKNCDYCLYVITPEMLGFYSIAEVMDDSHMRPHRTLFCVINRGKYIYSTGDDSGMERTFSRKQLHSLEAVKALVTRRGGNVLENLDAVAKLLNSRRNNNA